MPNRIIPKKSSVAGKAPAAGDLIQGELATNLADKKLYSKDSTGAVVELGENLKLGVTATDAATGNHLHVPANVTGLQALLDAKEDNLPADATGLLRNDGAGAFSWWTLPSTGMNFVGAFDPASMPTNAASSAGDFVIFNAVGTVSGVTVAIGDMAIYVAAGQWDVIENAADLTAYLKKPAVPASGYLHRTGAGTLAWDSSPSFSGVALTGAGGTHFAVAPAAGGGLSFTDIKNALVRLGINADGSITIPDLAGAGVRPVTANPSGQLGTSVWRTWATLTGKPATFPPIIGTTAAVAAAGNHRHTWAQITGKPVILALGTRAGNAAVGTTLATAEAYSRAQDTIKLAAAQAYARTQAAARQARIMGTAGRAVRMVGANNAGVDTTIWMAGNGKLGVGIAPALTCQVKGTLGASGDITAFYSDMRLKDIVCPLDNALDRVKQLEGFIYKPNIKAVEVGAVESGDEKYRVGVSAQMVEMVLPEAVSQAPFDMEADEDGVVKSRTGDNYMTVDYAKLVPLLIEAIKELSIQIEELR
jgi:hypothetical protein